MSEPVVHVHERASRDERCAFCHGSLDGEVSTCERCHVQLHQDCRAQLAKCPTLGCGDRPRAPVPPVIVTPVAPVAPARPRFTFSRRLALAELYARESILLLLGAILALGLWGSAGALVLNATLAVISYMRDEPAAAKAIADGIFPFAALLAIFVMVGVVATRALGRRVRAVRQVRAFLATEPDERTLVVTRDEPGGKFEFKLENVGPRGGINLQRIDAPTFALFWARRGRFPVRVYGLRDPARDALLVIESERGRLALTRRRYS